MSINLYMGPMYSAKSSRLIHEHQKWKCIDRATLVVNHGLDVRYGEPGHLYTHDLVKIPCLHVKRLSDIPDSAVKDCEAIFINEGQFFGDLKDKCLEWCEQMGKHIYVAGLDGDRNREKFGQMLDLIPYADHYEKLQAKCKLCRDGTPACFTHDVTNCIGESQVKVGSEQYLPLCRNHYLQHNCVAVTCH